MDLFLGIAIWGLRVGNINSNSFLSALVKLDIDLLIQLMDTLKDLAESLIILLYNFNCLISIWGITLHQFLLKKLIKEIDELMMIFYVLSTVIFVLNLRNDSIDFV